MSKDIKLIFENWDKYQELEELNEGPALDKVKYLVGKVGNLKTWFQSRKDREAVEAYTQSLLDKASNEFLRSVVSSIDSNRELKDFPNNENPEAFLTTVQALEAFYRTLERNVNLPEDDENYVDL